MRRRWIRLLALAAGLCLGILFASLGALALIFRASELPALPPAPQDSLVLRHVTLVNPRPGPELAPTIGGAGDPRQPEVTLRIAAGRIVAIEPEAANGQKTATAAEPSGAEDAAGGYVLPGLIDAHVHSPFLPGDHRLWATLYLLHGVTSVRNLGDGNQSLSHKAAVASGLEAGPRIFTCGIHLEGTQAGFFARTLRTEAEASAVVQELKASGVDCIKVLPHLSAATFAAVRTAARKAELPLVGHVVNAYDDRGIEESGIGDVQHLTGVPSAPSPGMDEDEWRRFHRGFDTLTPERIAHIVQVSQRLGVRHTPTLVGAAYEVEPRQGAAAVLLPRLELLPPWYGDLWQKLRRARTAEDRDLSRRNLPRYLAVVQALHRAGVAVEAGTDVFPFVPDIVPGAGLHDELRLLSQAGFSAEEALAAATIVPGSALARSLPNLGTLVVGGPADLLIFRQDPTVSLSNLESLQTVIVDGRRYERSALLQHLRVQLAAARRFPYSFSARLLSWLISIVA